MAICRQSGDHCDGLRAPYGLGVRLADGTVLNVLEKSAELPTVRSVDLIVTDPAEPIFVYAGDDVCVAENEFRGRLRLYKPPRFDHDRGTLVYVVVTLRVDADGRCRWQVECSTIERPDGGGDDDDATIRTPPTTVDDGCAATATDACDSWDFTNEEEVHGTVVLEHRYQMNLWTTMVSETIQAECSVQWSEILSRPLWAVDDEERDGSYVVAETPASRKRSGEENEEAAIVDECRDPTNIQTPTAVAETTDGANLAVVADPVTEIPGVVAVAAEGCRDSDITTDDCTRPHHAGLRLPRALGLEVEHGVVVNVVEKDADLPIVVTVEVVTASLRQWIGVYSGDSERPSENRFLGRVRLQKPRGCDVARRDRVAIKAVLTVRVDKYGVCSIDRSSTTLEPIGDGDRDAVKTTVAVVSRGPPKKKKKSFFKKIGAFLVNNCCCFFVCCCSGRTDGERE